jgi:hypothetical protein
VIYYTLIGSLNKTIFFSCPLGYELENLMWVYVFLNSCTCTKLFGLSFFLPFVSSLRLSRFSLLFGCSSFMFMSLKKVLVLIQTIQHQLLLYIITAHIWKLFAVNNISAWFIWKNAGSTEE